jgi:hypothetical protein
VEISLAEILKTIQVYLGQKVFSFANNFQFEHTQRTAMLTGDVASEEIGL